MRMFYCDECAKTRDWPETMFQSRGKCEVCGNDRPSRLLVRQWAWAAGERDHETD